MEFFNLTDYEKQDLHDCILIIGICADLIYNYSCDKIDYNEIIKKNQQMNLFDDFGIEYKYSNTFTGHYKGRL